MGIDVYMRWDGQTEEEHQAQFTGFDTTAGGVGYLREAYHGGPYATRELLPECFDDDLDGDGFVAIPAATLRGRLERVGAAVIERQRDVYGEAPDSEYTLAVLRSFGAFVALAERKEQETGQPVQILASW